MSEKKTVFTWKDIAKRTADIVMSLQKNGWEDRRDVGVYGVPRGGIYAAQALVTAAARNGRMPRFELVSYPADADLIFDDIVDTGKTKEKYQEQFPKIPFMGLVDKVSYPFDKQLGWVVFPWETANGDLGPQENVRRILQYIGEDPEREGLKETPDRVVRAYAEWFGGYKVDDAGIAKLLKTFNGENPDEMVVVRDIEFTSHCEHHMAPFMGVVHIGYVPNGKIVGLSKFGRLVDVFAQRLQVQERMTSEIGEAITKHLSPQGVAVVVRATHSCMSCRGVKKAKSCTTTSYLRGVFRTDPACRAEFMGLVAGK